MNRTRPVDSAGRHRWLRALLLAATALAVIAAVIVAGGLPRTIWGFPGSSAVWSLGFVGAGFLADRARSDIPVGVLLMLAGVFAGLQELVTVGASGRKRDGFRP